MSTPIVRLLRPGRGWVLWTAFWRALQPLRPACARTATFLWLVVVLAGLCLRPDLAGVTSLVRGLGLSEASYYCLLHFFHSPALDLEHLTRLWQQTLQRLFRRHLVRVNGRAVVLADGLKRPKEGKKMPGVKSLHQESRCNAKASFIMGHSLQAVAVLAQAAGVYLAVPVAARIHEGVVWSNRDRRTLLDKLGALLLGLPWEQPVTVVADAYYAAAKFARCLLGRGEGSPRQVEGALAAPKSEARVAAAEGAGQRDGAAEAILATSLKERLERRRAVGRNGRGCRASTPTMEKCRR